MKNGQCVKLPVPVTGQDLAKFLATYANNRVEAYVRVEDVGPVLYLVRRDPEALKNGTIFASFPIPLFPEEV